MTRQHVFSADVQNLYGVLPDMRAGDRVLLSGDIYTARDAAHMAMFQMMADGAPLPFDISGAVIYYAGPTPGFGELPFGSCGPTTSGRMDAFAPKLYDMGLVATIGKGERDISVLDAIVRNAAVYLCAVGGAGAVIARHIVKAEEIAFFELGCESVKRLTVQELPLTVGIDCRGGDIFKTGREMYVSTAQL